VTTLAVRGRPRAAARVWRDLFATRPESLIGAIHSLIAPAHGRQSPASLVEFCIDRIERFNLQGPGLGAILEVNALARHRASLAAMLAAADRARAPLRGLPLILKDNISTASDPLNTTCGSHFLLGTRVRTDATVTARAKAAGAVVLAKANMYEMGMTVPSARGGPVRNPLDGCRTQPGGSSNGVAVALAAGMGVAGFGTDARGSIRVSCAECALSGLRPTTGLVSRHGVVAFELVDVVGPLATSVTDLAILLGVVAADADPLDPVTQLYQGPRAADYTPHLRGPAGLRGARLATLRGLASRLTPEVAADYASALALIRESGATLVDIPSRIWRRPNDVIGSASHAAASTIAARALARFIDNWAADSRLRSLDDLRASLRSALPSGIHLKRADPSAILAFLDRPRLAGDEVGASAELLARLRAPFVTALQASGLDALVVPTGAWALPVDGPLSPGLVRHDFTFGVLTGLAGLPEIVTPMSARPGRPIGLSFVGPPCGEASLLTLAHAFERVRAARMSDLPWRPV
jgi:amidase